MPNQQSKPHPVGNKHIVNQGYDQEIANMRIALKKVEAYAPFGQHETALRYLQEFAGYQDNALACRDCQATDMPLTLAEGGSSPEYQCPVCHAKQAIAWYDQEQQDLAEGAIPANPNKPPTNKSIPTNGSVMGDNDYRALPRTTAHYRALPLPEPVGATPQGEPCYLNQRRSTCDKLRNCVACRNSN